MFERGFGLRDKIISPQAAILLIKLVKSYYFFGGRCGISGWYAQKKHAPQAEASPINTNKEITRKAKSFFIFTPSFFNC